MKQNNPVTILYEKLTAPPPVRIPSEHLEHTLARFLALDADAHGLFVAAAALRGGGSFTLEKVAALADSAPLTAANAAELGSRLKDR